LRSQKQRCKGKSRPTHNAREAKVNAYYLLHLYNLYQEFVTTPPAVQSITDKNTGKIRYNLSFATLALPCFNELYEAFYLEGKKIIPNNIADLPLLLTVPLLLTTLCL
jgi:hypothetical protein